MSGIKDGSEVLIRFLYRETRRRKLVSMKKRCSKLHFTKWLLIEPAKSNTGWPKSYFIEKHLIFLL